MARITTLEEDFQALGLLPMASVRGVGEQGVPPALPAEDDDPFAPEADDEPPVPEADDEPPAPEAGEDDPPVPPKPEDDEPPVPPKPEARKPKKEAVMPPAPPAKPGDAKPEDDEPPKPEADDEPPKPEDDEPEAPPAAEARRRLEALKRVLRTSMDGGEVGAGTDQPEGDEPLPPPTEDDEPVPPAAEGDGDDEPPTPEDDEPPVPPATEAGVKTKPGSEQQRKKWREYAAKHKGTRKKYAATHKTDIAKHRAKVAKQRHGKAAKGTRIYTGMDRVSNLIEQTQGLVDQLNESRLSEAARSFANIALISEDLGKGFRHQAQVRKDEELSKISRVFDEMADDSAVVAQDVLKRKEGDDGQLDDPETAEAFRMFMQDLLDGVELYDDLTGDPDAPVPPKPEGDDDPEAPKPEDDEPPAPVPPKPTESKPKREAAPPVPPPAAKPEDDEPVPPKPEDDDDPVAEQRRRVREARARLGKERKG